MLKNGISYKSLQINPDVRLGFDAEIDAFNKKLCDMSEKIFVSPSND